MSGENKTPDILGMSDEDFLNMAPVGDSEIPTGKTQEELDAEAAAQAETDKLEAEAAERAEAEAAAKKAAEETPALGSKVEDPASQTDPNKVESNSGKVAPNSQPTQNAATVLPNQGNTDPALADKGKTDDPAAATQVAAINYEAEYKRLMAPIKANGKMIDIRTPDELIQLAQMGANYTRKMQDIAPHRKMLLMLENNGLLDEGKLSYLIDIDKKNPEAIKKLLKDSGINPLDIDTESTPQYQATSHAVTDEAVAFRTVLDELSSHDDGQKTLQAIHSGWDDVSKNQLWKDPSIMQVIHEHRANGVYDRIAGEIERRRTLGVIPTGTTFLQSYKQVGDELQARNGFADLVQPQAQTPAAAAPATPVATRVVAPKSQVTNSDAASAAATTRSSTRRAEVLVNPLAMSDEEFMKLPRV